MFMAAKLLPTAMMMEMNRPRNCSGAAEFGLRVPIGFLGLRVDAQAPIIIERINQGGNGGLIGST